MGIERRLALVLGDPLLNHAVRHGDDLVHGGIEPLPRFRAFDVFRLRLHGSIMAHSQRWDLLPIRFMSIVGCIRSIQSKQRRLGE